MITNVEEVKTEVLSGLTALIVWHKSAVACRGRFPGMETDASDALIDEYGVRVIELRKIREQFENVFD